MAEVLRFAQNDKVTWVRQPLIAHRSSLSQGSPSKEFGHAPCLGDTAFGSVWSVGVENLAYCSQARLGQMGAYLGQQCLEFEAGGTITFYYPHCIEVRAEEPCPGSSVMI